LSIEVQILREKVTKLVPMLAGRGITVTQRGDKAYVKARNGRPYSVNIPNIPDNATQDLIVAIEGFLDHEVGHLLFTDWDGIEASFKGGKRLASLTNIIEDPFVERRMQAQFPGSKDNLEQVQRFILDRYTSAMLPRATEPAHYITILMMPAIRAWAGQPIFQEFMKDKWHYIKSFTDIIGDLSDRVATVGSTWDSLNLAKDMIERLKDAAIPDMSPSASSDDSEEGEGESVEESSEGESKSSKKKEKGDKEEKDEGDEGKSKEDGDDSEEEAEGDEEKDADGKGGADEDDAEEEGSSEKDDGKDSDGEGEGESSSDGDDAEDDADEGTSGDGESDAEDDTEEEGDAGEGKSDGDDGDADADGEDDGGDADSEGEADGEGEGGDTGGDDDAIDGESSDGPTGGSEADDELHDGKDGPSADPELVGALLDAIEDAKDFDDAASGEIGKMAAGVMGSSDYLIFTRDDDLIQPLVPHDLPKMQAAAAKMEEEMRQVCGVMQKDLERFIAAQSRSVNIPGHRSGRLHSAALAKLTFNDDRVFRRREIHKSKDTAVSLLVDCSGSMRSGSYRKSRIAIACEAAYALAFTLERINVKFEALGFTTLPASTETVHEMGEAKARIGRGFSRVEPIYMPIFKDFGERMNSVVKARFAAGVHELGLRNNLDGESVEIAARRLALRREERKILIVLSDGFPCAYGSSSEQNAKLRNAVNDAEKYKVEVLGIGIESDAVQHFYKNNVVINTVDDLPKMLVSRVAKMLHA